MYHFASLQPAAQQLPIAVRPRHIGRVLVIEEDAGTRSAILTYLEDHEWSAVACTPQEIGRHLHNQQLSLVIMSARLRARDALDLVREVRSRSYVPIILFRTDGEPAGVERIVGLELGADDFLSGPLNLEELMARARAILRRHELGRLAPQPLRGGYRFAGWELRHAGRTLTSPYGDEVSLTKNEYALLNALLEAPGRPLSRLHLMRSTRVHEDIYDRSIDVQVLRVRRKLSREPGGEELIKTERGYGYRLDAQVEPWF